MASSNWAHLIATSRKTSKEFLKFVESEIEYQDIIEEQGYRSPTGKVLRVLQNIHGAKTLHGESAAAVQPKFQGAQGAQRGGTVLWGKTEEAQVVLWDSVKEEDKAWCRKDMVSNTKWVIWKSKETGKGNQKEEKWLHDAGVCIFQS